MTPVGLHDEYRDLYVDLMDGQLIEGLDIHEYRNHELKGGFSTESGMAAYELVKAKVVKHLKHVGTHLYRFTFEQTTKFIGYTKTIYGAKIIITWPDLIRPFLGKGTPDDIRTAIQLAVHFELLEPSKNAIQRYCDANIGIDCSGFASAYYGGTWMGRGATYYRDNARKITKLEEIRPGDAIVWKSGVHIALIDSICNLERSSGMVCSMDCSVAESTGDRMSTDGPADGLMISDYSLLFDGPGKFKALRSLVQKGKDTYYSPEVVVVRPC